MKVPHHTKYCIVDEETNILLTGVPDEVFLCEDGSFAIIDYKTARYTAHQNNLNDKDNVRSLFAWARSHPGIARAAAPAPTNRKKSRREALCLFIISPVIRSWISHLHSYKT